MKTIPVQYIGRREFWKDTVYGTGISFDRDEIQRLPADIAAKFIKHCDLFRRAEKELCVETQEAVIVTGEAKRLSEEAAREARNFETADRVREMDKEALEQFARERFGVSLDTRRSLKALREEVSGLVIQFAE